MTTALDSDRALEDEAKDRFGFSGMAERLAPSVVEASKGDGIVIGLEGRWGSGKTSLLNFLRKNLAASEVEGVHTITIAPWLNGDTSPLVSSLLEPMAEILKQREGEVAAASGHQESVTKRKMAEVSELLRAYGPKTARRIASVANVAGYVLPGAQTVGKVVGEIADVADQVLPYGQTPSQMKQELAQKLQELDLGFIVILDDLDRLEPEQAVEVIRLVRSVADFPKVAYLMCYDREVLAQALETGLKVTDGDLFLQKIVQLTFNIPLPEPFDLRSLFLDEAQSIYVETIGEDLKGELLDDFRSAADREGAELTTPREVKLALNSIRFVFPQVKSDIYFPDLCRLQLIKATNYKLYKWIEEYLAVRSVLVTGDATVSEQEKSELGQEIKKLLPSDDVRSSRSISNLGRFIPGLANTAKPDERVFSVVNKSAFAGTIRLKRLGSPFHHRFYFALTGSKTVMPDGEFDALLELARHDIDQLAVRFCENAQKRRRSGKTWFEHVLERLDDELISSLDEDQLSGVLTALSHMMDVALREDNGVRLFSLSLDRIANEVAKKCLKRLHELNHHRQSEVVRYMAREGKAINWLVGEFFRSQLFDHGRVGERAGHPEQWEITDSTLDEAIEILKVRFDHKEILDSIPKFPDILAYLYGWLDIAADGKAAAWVNEYSESDEGFIFILHHLRGWAMSDKIYHPLSQETVSNFLDWGHVTARLERMAGGEFANQVIELKLAIEQARH
ncbi:P-loop NTPase fold protein [Salinicola lusitanus]|uniref:P-loop NTPase fold protein n=1 Tax=Salinicola lusitanus TaxID=1949085 RepID=A0ABZ3CVW0_9GAMM